MRFVLLSMVLIGCSEFPIQTECKTKYVRSIIAEKEIDCEVVNKNLYLARDIMMDSGLINGESDWRVKYEEITIWVAADWDLIPHQPLHGDLAGYYDDINETIQTSGSQRTLLHELLHRYQSEIGEYDTTFHANWDKNGFYDIIAIYQGTYILPER